MDILKVCILKLQYSILTSLVYLEVLALSRKMMKQI